MTKDKTPEWLERAQAEIAQRVQSMTPEEEAAYGIERSKEFDKYKRELRGSKAATTAKVA